MSPELLQDFLSARDTLKRIERDIGLVMARVEKTSNNIFKEFIPTLDALHIEARTAITHLENEFEVYMVKHYGGRK